MFRLFFILGYEDGKLKIGGSLGAALGVGAGGGVTVEVDVRQIGQMAKNAADLNHDGRLDWKDAFEAVKRTAGFVMPGFGLAHLVGGATPAAHTTTPRTFLDPSAFTLPKIRRAEE